MINGNTLMQNLARQLARAAGDQSPGSTQSGRRRNPQVDLTDNPLFLATDVAVPAADLHIDVDPPGDTSNPFLNRQRSHESSHSASSQPYYESTANSPRAEIYPDNINDTVEVASMPHSTPSNNRTRSANVDPPIDAIDVANLNVIGTPPPGYSTREEPPIERVLKEANRVWFTPMLAGLPTFLDKWWKNLRAAKSPRGKGKLKGIGGVMQGIKDKTLALEPHDIFTARVAGGFVLFLLAVFLIYAWYEQRKRNENIVFDTDRFNLDPTKVISLVPKKKYIADKANHMKRAEPRQGLPKETRSTGAFDPYQYPSPNETRSTGLFNPYQYPPSRNNYRHRR